MSLAVLKRKTKAKQRLRTRGNFILNMTGRGNVLGMNAKMNTRNCGANTKQCRGRRARCCNESPIEPDCCRFKHGGKPAPQMGYRVYLNRKSNGAYRPAGGPCCKTAAAQENAKAVWQQPANIGAGEIVQNKKDTTIACYHQTNDNSALGSAHCSSETCSGKDTYISLAKYKLNVGHDSGGDGQWGFDGEGATSFGNICPTRILLGHRIKTMDYQSNGGVRNLDLSIDITGVTHNITQCSIDSLTLVDNRTSSIKTYKASDADFSAGATTARWRWWGEDTAYWQDVSGQCLDVTIDIPRTKIHTVPCAVEKNICGCRGTDLVRYVRINHQRCHTTKTLPFNVTAHDQIIRKRSDTLCPKYGASNFKKPYMLGSCAGR